MSREYSSLIINVAKEEKHYVFNPIEVEYIADDFRKIISHEGKSTDEFIDQVLDILDSYEIESCEKDDYDIDYKYYYSIDIDNAGINYGFAVYGFDYNGSKDDFLKFLDLVSPVNSENKELFKKTNICDRSKENSCTLLTIFDEVPSRCSNYELNECHMKNNFVKRISLVWNNMMLEMEDNDCCK